MMEHDNGLLRTFQRICSMLELLCRLQISFHLADQPSHGGRRRLHASTIAL